jgi:hypothetical protein
VLEIYNSRENQTVQAARFCVHQAVISGIRTGKFWRHVTGQGGA